MTSRSSKPDIAVVGAGRLGTTLALALQAHGYRVVAVTSRRRAHARALAERLNARVCSERVVWESARLVVLTVPDDAIAELAREARAQLRPGQAVIHCSGALGLDALAPVAEAGAQRGCLHPLQSFPERFGAADRFAGIHCGLEGDGALARQLASMVRALGARPFSLHGVDRARYHAAAVFASNYVVALHAAAEQAWSLAGLPREQARAALVPLSQGAVSALRALPIERALTGPLARGDVQTIDRQLRALRAAPELHAVYAQLAGLLLARPLALGPKPRARLRALLRAQLRPDRKRA